MTQDNEEFIFELIDDFTSSGRFYFYNESLWMISPKTKEWIFEFTKSGKLWYSYVVFDNIFKYISLEYPDFTPYITKWVERILQNEVKDTTCRVAIVWLPVERILQNEVKDTEELFREQHHLVERIIQNEVKDTEAAGAPIPDAVERIIQNEVKHIDYCEGKRLAVKTIIQNESI